jgi:hypothetical protein
MKTIWINKISICRELAKSVFEETILYETSYQIDRLQRK